MSDAQNAKDFVAALLQEFRDDDIGQMFLSAAIVSGALDISKRNPDHIYQGFIKGRDWVAVANRILAIREQQHQERVKNAALTGGPAQHMVDLNQD